VTVLGGNIFYLSGTNTYTGPTTISGSKLQLGTTSATGSLSPSSAIINNGELEFNRTNAMTQGIDFASVISGTGQVTNDAGSLSAVTYLNGANTYTGVTSLGAGTLSVAVIGNGGVAGNLGAATNAAANLGFFGTANGGLQYTGVTASTDRNFTISIARTAVFEVTNSATNLTFTGGSDANSGLIFKAGPGTLTLAGSMANTGATTVNAGTLVLDYTATNSSKLSNTAALIFSGGTLQLDRATAASGNHVEVVLSTTLSGAASITRGAGTTTAVLQMNAITRNPGSSVDFGAASIANTDTNNATGTGMLGPWATINGTNWAKSVDSGAADTAITAYSSYTDVARLGGTHIIADGATTNVRIVEGSGAAGSFTLGATVTTINTLNQSSTGGPANITTAGHTLAVNGILAGLGSSALTIGAGVNSGTLTAGAAGGELILLNYGGGLTINSTIADNGAASSLTQTGPGVTVLAGTNTYTGKTIISSGKLSIAAESGLGGNPAGYTVDQLTLNGGTLLSTAAFSIDDGNRGIRLGPAGGTFEVGAGTLALGPTNIISESSLPARLTKTGPGTLLLSGVNTYTGLTTVADGILAYGVGNALASGAVTVAGGTLSLGGNSDTVGPVTLSGGSITGTTGTLTATNFNVESGSISAKLAGAGITMIKTTAGTVTLTGATTFTGRTAIIAGALEAAGPGALAATAGIQVSGSGTLRLAGSGDRIGDAVPVQFTGGTFETAGLSENAGAFTLAGSATLDLGAGASVLHFADSSAFAWSGTLSITNWSGSPTGGGTDELFFGTTASGLTPAQLALISFVDPVGFAPGTYAATMLAGGEVVAIPEPASAGLLASGLLGLLGFRRGRARRA
jgi:autotransporter-associated beta strand protein